MLNCYNAVPEMPYLIFRSVVTAIIYFMIYVQVPHSFIISSIPPIICILLLFGRHIKRLPSFLLSLVSIDTELSAIGIRTTSNFAAFTE